jgi:hypothetical protein
MEIKIKTKRTMESKGQRNLIISNSNFGLVLEVEGSIFKETFDGQELLKAIKFIVEEIK